ncbi:hypothetical protein PUNSTDRAFT_59807 [Punctularia strigosozonata HHB-11173 SS5]|uniref:uncharacterized protein n=1 Tax=Punctularia strigosozonata (strain HHB-11173) TaxID=741275 RepID=UPI000441647F|nr:uncharacterized protein PUNSTDRAFT_59807 [Punctularia strigosozonata HHB-11173 SS5]EIN13957.1 hypothetical protein PUNSTDRAFT_59807 [Punctularia strigosozonata HHB-11173 SS5]
MVAIKICAEKVPHERALDIETDSKYVIGETITYLKKREDSGYIAVANREIAKATVAALRMRPKNTSMKWIKGHNGHERNEGADRKAAEAVKKTTCDDVPLEIPPTLKVTGAKLSKMTQKLAYKAIRETKMKEYRVRERAARNIELVQDASKSIFNKLPSPARIWKSIQNKDIARETRYFLWMAMHDAYMLGDKWLRPSCPADLRERSVCAHCDKIESMEHILTECRASGQEEIWSLACNLWKKKNTEINLPSHLVGAILGSQCTEIRNSKGKIKRGQTRLYRILIAESAHLIWKMRCQRVIRDGNQPKTRREVRNRWKAAINARLKLDCRLADRASFGAKAVNRDLVLETWSGTLQNENLLPEDWVGWSGVLVGMDPD